MKSTIAKTFKTIFIVLAIVLLVITAVLYFIDTPVVEEGQEPTAAQKFVLLGKEYLSEILLACGASGIGLIGVFAKLIYNSVKNGLDGNAVMAAKIAQLEAKLEESEKTKVEQNQSITIMSKKQDIANNLLMTIFSLSELPVSLREQIYSAQTEYNGVGNVKDKIEPTVEIIKNADENRELPVKKDSETDKEKPVTTAEEADVPSAPVYM